MALAKILIVGRGYLAERYARHFGERAAVSPVDITDLAALEAVIKERRPATVINAAGKTLTGAIEKPENRDEAYRVNVQGPAGLAYLGRLHGFHLVHLSTLMFFDGERPGGGGWREGDLPNPTNYYAWTKAWADSQLAPFAERDGILILRLHTPLSRESHPRNLLNKLAGFDRVVDIPESRTCVEDLMLASERLVAAKASGIFHVTNPGSISLAAIVTMMKEGGLLPADKAVGIMKREELEAGIRERGGAAQAFPIADTGKLRRAGIILPGIEEAARAAIKNFSEPA